MTARNSFSNMVFLPPTPLIIDCYIAKVPAESRSKGLQPPWSFAAWAICIVLVCPKVLADL
ncbi:MAG: hypothetical protein V7K94_14675 [Nostoc sp.]|uniref:hypothetical protein n=1 Tax=Nostoc sp. TaxID=1180 RepID=UPI002FFC3281